MSLSIHRHSNLCAQLEDVAQEPIKHILHAAKRVWIHTSPSSYYRNKPLASSDDLQLLNDLKNSSNLENLPTLLQFTLNQLGLASDLHVERP